MAGTFIDVKVEGGEEIGAALDQLKHRGENLKTVFADIGEYLVSVHDERFRRQVDPQGNPWAPLNPDYLKRKKRNKHRILVLDDYLGGTLHYEATAESLLFGSDRPYAATHQFGREEANIKARPFLGLSSGDVSEVKRLLGEWVFGT